MKHNFPKELQKQLSKTDPDRLNGYIEMFDRLLLYNVALNVLPDDAVDDILEKWEQAIKHTINTESTLRTTFLQSTPQGRMARKQKEPDGEAMRLQFLDTLDLAKMIVSRNLQKVDEDDISDDGNDSSIP